MKASYVITLVTKNRQKYEIETTFQNHTLTTSFLLHINDACFNAFRTEMYASSSLMYLPTSPMLTSSEAAQSLKNKILRSKALPETHEQGFLNLTHIFTHLSISTDLEYNNNTVLP